MWMNSLAVSAVVFVTRVKVGVVWAAASLIPPSAEPNAKTKPSINKAAIAHEPILFLSILFSPFTLNSGETTRKRPSSHRGISG